MLRNLISLKSWEQNILRNSEKQVVAINTSEIQLEISHLEKYANILSFWFILKGKGRYAKTLSVHHVEKLVSNNLNFSKICQVAATWGTYMYYSLYSFFYFSVASKMIEDGAYAV